MKLRLFPSLLFALLTTLARAEVACPVIFSDHMVLQRESPVAIWGTATPDEQVTVEFAGQSKTAKTSTDGKWRIDLDAMPASKEPRLLTVRGNNTLRFVDVLVGEVWFCSGQSNMEKQLGPRKGQKPTDNYEEATRQANHPLLRLYQVPHYSKPTDKILSLRWVACTPETVTAAEFSAAGYYFGAELLRKLDVPVGLIHSSYGGTMIEAWTPREAFERTPELAPLLAKPYQAWVKGVQATELFNSMVAPYVPYTLRGFLWYQGESNLMAGDTDIYTLKLRTLIESWRALWTKPDAPFYYVLLAPFRYSPRDKDPAQLTAEALPLFWEAQIATAKIVPHTGFVVTTDIGNPKDIHPTNKRGVGLRLATLALAETYGSPNTAAQSPRFASKEISANKIILRFSPASPGLKSRDGKPLDGFLIAGSDKNFVPANAVIEGDTVVVTAPAIASPVAVRFAWSEAANPNLVNSVGLPVAPFRTDDWPVIYRRPAPSPATESSSTPKPASP
ncbi:MAG: sialate O-acetylesterase [Nibricoccus sp.]